MLFYIDIYLYLQSYIISNSSPTYKGSHQIDVGDFLLKNVKFTYDNEPIYLMIENYSTGYHIFTYEELDLTKLKVEGVTLIEQYRAFSPTSEGILTVSLMILVAAVLVHGVLFCAIFFFVRFLIRRNRKAKADLGL